MYSIQRICDSISDKVVKELEIDESQKAVINYGLFAIIQTVISAIMCIVFGLVFNVLIPSLIISLTGVILRKYSGGAHAQTPETCTAIGTIISVGGAIILSKIHWNAVGVMVLGGLVYFLGTYLVCRLAPVDSRAKPIKKLAKKQVLKKKSIFVIGIYLVITVIALWIYSINHNKEWLVYIVCIYGGTVWQVFTLTSYGHIVMAGMDDLFNKLLKIG